MIGVVVALIDVVDRICWAVTYFCQTSDSDHPFFGILIRINMAPVICSTNQYVATPSAEVFVNKRTRVTKELGLLFKPVERYRQWVKRADKLTACIVRE